MKCLTGVKLHAFGGPGRSRRCRYRDPRTCVRRKVVSLQSLAVSVVTDADTLPTASIEDDFLLLENYAEQAGLNPHLVLRLAALQPQLVELPPEVLFQQLDTLSKTLDTSLQRTVQIVAKFPQVLDIPQDKLQDSYAQLARSLNLTTQQLRSVLAARPGLLTETSANVAAFEQSCTQLSLALQVPAVAATDMLARLSPSEFAEVACLSQAELRGRVQDLFGMIATSNAQRPQEAGNGTLGAQAQIGGLLMLMKAPSLLTLSSDRVLQSLDALAYVFHGPLRHFAGVLTRAPRLLTVPAPELRCNFDALTALLGAGHHRSSKLCFMEPRLLLLSPLLLSKRLEALQHLLYLDRGQAAQVVVRQPFVLRYRPAYLRAKLAALMRSMRVSPEVLSSMIIRRPRLLLTSTPKMLAVIDTLTHMLQVPRGSVVRILQDQPVLLTSSPDKMEANFNGQLELLGVADEKWARQVVSHPVLLTVSPASLKESITDLSALLGLPELQVVSMAVRNAGFLCVPLRQCKANYDLVLERLSVSPELLSVAVAGAPFILTMPTSRLQARCSSLSRVLRSSPRWLAEWSTLMPRELAALLGLTDRQMEHVQYIAQKGQQSQVSLLDPILLDRNRFTRRFPAFTAVTSWKSQNHFNTSMRPSSASMSNKLMQPSALFGSPGSSNPMDLDRRQEAGVGLSLQEGKEDPVGEGDGFAELDGKNWDGKGPAVGRERLAVQDQELDGAVEEQTLRSIPVTQKIPDGGRKGRAGTKWIGRGMKSQEIV